MKWVFLTLFIVLLLSLVWFISALQRSAESVPKPEIDFVVIDDTDASEPVLIAPATITASSTVRDIYPELVPITIAGIAVEASVARTDAERAQGLSNTPFLPQHVVKLFVFDSPAKHGFWMKEMQYPIDIIWVDANRTIVHIEPSVDPDTFPRVFAPNVPALYVIETVAGFAHQHQLALGDVVELSGEEY